MYISKPAVVGARVAPALISSLRCVYKLAYFTAGIRVWADASRALGFA